MKRSVSIVFLAAALLATFFVQAQELPKPPPKSEKPLVVEPAKHAAKPAIAETVGARRELSLREARKKGITLLSVRAHRKALIESGDIEPSMSSAEQAAAVLDRLAASNPKEFGDEAGIDIDSLLAFIEKLIDLITKLFAQVSTASLIVLA